MLISSDVAEPNSASMESSGTTTGDEGASLSAEGPLDLGVGGAEGGEFCGDGDGESESWTSGKACLIWSREGSGMEGSIMSIGEGDEEGVSRRMGLGLALTSFRLLRGRLWGRSCLNLVRSST